MNSHWCPLEDLFENWRIHGSRCNLHLFGHFFLGWQRKRLSAISRSNFLQYRILNTGTCQECNGYASRDCNNRQSCTFQAASRFLGYRVGNNSQPKSGEKRQYIVKHFPAFPAFQVYLPKKPVLKVDQSIIKFAQVTFPHAIHQRHKLGAFILWY